VKDALGRDILVGDFIIYPGHQGSSLWLTIGRVTAVGDDGRVSVRRKIIGRTSELVGDGYTAQLHRAVVVDAGQVSLALQQELA
jgi:hypothetical protein